MLSRFRHSPGLLIAGIFAFVIGMGFSLKFFLDARHPASVNQPVVVAEVTFGEGHQERISDSSVVVLDQVIKSIGDVDNTAFDASDTDHPGILAFFKTGIDSETAHSKLKAVIQSLKGKFPPLEEPQRFNVTVMLTSLLIFLRFESSDRQHDYQYLYDFSQAHVVEKLRLIPGVNHVAILGSLEHRLQIHLDPDRLRKWHITAADVMEELQSLEGVESAPRLIPTDDQSSGIIEYVFHHDPPYLVRDGFAKTILFVSSNGIIVRLDDVAEVTVGPLYASYYNVYPNKSGRPSVVIAVQAAARANSDSVVKLLTKELEELSKTSFSSGMSVDITYEFPALSKPSQPRTPKRQLESSQAE